MNLFGKKNKEVQEPKPAIGVEALWLKHAELKTQKHQLATELAEIEAKLLKVAQAESLFKGKTATFANGRKIRTQYTPRVLAGREFDIADFADKYPHLCKTELNSKQIKEAFEDADKAKVLQELGLDVEIKTYYKYE